MKPKIFWGHDLDLFGVTWPHRVKWSPDWWGHVTPKGQSRSRYIVRQWDRYLVPQNVYPILKKHLIRFLRWGTHGLHHVVRQQQAICSGIPRRACTLSKRPLDARPGSGLVHVTDSQPIWRTWLRRAAWSRSVGTPCVASCRSLCSHCLSTLRSERSDLRQTKRQLSTLNAGDDSTELLILTSHCNDEAPIEDKKIVFLSTIFAVGLDLKKVLVMVSKKVLYTSLLVCCYLAVTTTLLCPAHKGWTWHNFILLIS